MLKSILIAISVGAVMLAPQVSIAGGITRTKAEYKALGGTVTNHYKQYGNYWCKTKTKDRRCEELLKVKFAFYNIEKKRCARPSNDSGWQELYE